jgi:UDP-N-acetylglucosamine 2-epimerase (non-hydrolysing)
MKKIVMIVGARPNFMKAFPVYLALKEDFEITLIHTGQHFDAKMSDVFFNQLSFPKPDIHFDLESKSRAGDIDEKLYTKNAEYLQNKKKVITELKNMNNIGQLGEIRDKLTIEFEKIKPDLVIVFGDVTSTLAAALAALNLNIEVAHIESGLRSFDLEMPEEVNRILTDSISNYLFVTEQSGVDNLKKEGITENVYLVGNTMIDCLMMFKDKALETKYHEVLGAKEKEYVLITLHRPSNVDNLEKLKEIVNDIVELSKDEKIIFPIHPRTKKNIENLGINLGENIIVCEPLGYLEFTCLEAKAKYVVTDSGGIQEETTALGVSCFTLRENTERPSTLVENGGTNILINNLKQTNNLLKNVFLFGTCRINKKSYENNEVYNPIFYMTCSEDLKEIFEIMSGKKICDENVYFNLSEDYHKYTNFKISKKIFIIEICSLKTNKYKNHIVPYKFMKSHKNYEEIKITIEKSYEILNEIINKYYDCIFIFIGCIITDDMNERMKKYRNEINDHLIKLCDENKKNCFYEQFLYNKNDILDFYHIKQETININIDKIIKKYYREDKKCDINTKSAIEIKNIIYSICNEIFIPFGYGCETAEIIKKIDLRKFSLPFDYINFDLECILRLISNDFMDIVENNFIYNSDKKLCGLKKYGPNVFLHYPEKKRFLLLIDRFKNILKTKNINFVSIYLNNKKQYRNLDEFLSQYEKLNNYIKKKYSKNIYCFIINSSGEQIDIKNNSITIIDTKCPCEKINDNPQDILNIIKDELVYKKNFDISCVKKYIYNETNDEIFYQNKLSLLELVNKCNYRYKDMIYLEIGKKFKNFLKSYSSMSLRYFYKAIEIKNGSIQYSVKLCLYLENIIYTYPFERGQLAFNSLKLNNINNSIKNFYYGLFKYVNNNDDYELFLNDFKKSNVQIYLSIPMKTYTFTNEIFDENKILNEYIIDSYKMSNKILIITSCDINYFKLYATYLLKSFCKYEHGDDIILAIDIIINKNENLDEIQNIYDEYKNKNKIKLSIKNVECENIKAYSSTLRYARAYYESLNNNKILVIDIDSIFVFQIDNLFEQMKTIDIGSGILEKTFPWQKYTAGFCFFNNTIHGKKILKDIFINLNNKMKSDEELWWIDQNSLEYSIRINLANIKITNYFGIKDKYILSPTGNIESKIKVLSNI